MTRQLTKAPAFGALTAAMQTAIEAHETLALIDAASYRHGSRQASLRAQYEAAATEVRTEFRAYAAIARLVESKTGAPLAPQQQKRGWLRDRVLAKLKCLQRVSAARSQVNEDIYSTNAPTPKTRQVLCLGCLSLRRNLHPLKMHE